MEDQQPSSPTHYSRRHQGDRDSAVLLLAQGPSDSPWDPLGHRDRQSSRHHPSTLHCYPSHQTPGCLRDSPSLRSPGLVRPLGRSAKDPPSASLEAREDLGQAGSRRHRDSLEGMAGGATLHLGIPHSQMLLPPGQDEGRHPSPWLLRRLQRRVRRSSLHTYQLPGHHRLGPTPTGQDQSGPPLPTRHHPTVGTLRCSLAQPPPANCHGHPGCPS